MCESMGWAFVKDYKNGKMNTIDKSREAIAFGIFNLLMLGFNHGLDIQKPAEMLQNKAAQALELIIPSLASHLIENKGKINSDFLEHVVKGSLFSLVCSDILGDTSNMDKKLAEQKTKTLLSIMMRDEETQKILNDALLRNGIKSFAEIKLSKNQVKNLASLADEVVPKLKNLYSILKGI